MAGQTLKIRWAATALTDLDRFAAFLIANGSPQLAASVAKIIESKTRTLIEHPRIGRPIAGSKAFREFSFQALHGRYVLRYRIREADIIILRVFHAREQRDPRGG